MWSFRKEFLKSLIREDILNCSNDGHIIKCKDRYKNFDNMQNGELDIVQ